MSEHPRPERQTAASRVEFRLTQSRYPFVAASAAGCRFELAEIVPRAQDRYAEFFNVRGAETERVEDLASSGNVIDVSCLREYDRGGLFEFLVGDSCPAIRLAEFGALPRRMWAEGGEGRIVAEIPSRFEATSVLEEFLDETRGTELVAKREIDAVSPMLSTCMFGQILDTRLTDRQSEVLRAAYDAGYYDWPRQATGGDVAARLDISSATFSEHIRAAERTLLHLVFEQADER